MFPLELTNNNADKYQEALERIGGFINTLKEKQKKAQDITTEEVLYLKSLGELLNQIAQTRLLSQEDLSPLVKHTEQIAISQNKNWFLLEKSLSDIIELCAKLGYGLQDQQLSKWLQTAHITKSQLIAGDKNQLEDTLKLIKKQMSITTNFFTWPETTLGKVELLTFEQRLAELDRYHPDNADTTKSHNVTEISQLEAKYFYQLGQTFLLPTLARHDLSQTHVENYLAAAQHIGRLLQNAGLNEMAFAWYCQLTQINPNRLNRWLGNSLVAIGEVISNTQSHLAQASHWLDQRENLKNSYNKDSNKAICQFIVDLLKTTKLLLGIAPVKFCVMLSNSANQNISAAYSAFECIVVIENTTDINSKTPTLQNTFEQQRAFYLKNFFALFEFRVRSMGRLCGYYLDDNSHLRSELLTIGTPEQLVKNYLNKANLKQDNLAFSLLHPVFLYGDAILGDGYIKALNTALNSAYIQNDSCKAILKIQQPSTPISWYHYLIMTQLQYHCAKFEKYCIEKTQTTDLDKPYAKLLNVILFDIALYHRLPTHDLVNTIQHLKYGHYLEPWFIDSIVEHMNYLQNESFKKHSTQKTQSNSTQFSHQLRLKQIYCEILKPFYTALPVLFAEGYASFQQALWLELALTRTLTSQNTACSTQIVESSQLSTAWYLPTDWCNEIFDTAGNVKPTSEMRNSAIFNFGNYCLKIIAPDENNLQTQQEVMKTFLAREYAVNQLARLLGFNVTVPGCALWLRYKTANGKEKVYAGWLCEKITGRNLSNPSLNKSADLQQIDTDSYTALFLLSLLIYPEDGQLHNFLLSPNYGNEGKSCRLVSVDNKRVFVNAIETNSNFLGLNKTQTLQLKTALYFLPQFTQTLSLAVIQQATCLDMVAIIQAWSNYLCHFDAAVGMILYQTKTQKVETAFSNLAIDPFLVSALPLRYQQLINFLLEITMPTPNYVLEKYEPEVVKYYREFKKEYRLQDFGAEQKLFAEAYKRDSQGRTYAKTTWLNLQKYKLKPEEIAKQLFQTEPQLIVNLGWEVFDKIQQYSLLQLLKTLPQQKLYLANCIVLTEADLLILLQNSPDLIEIDITGCNLTEKVFDWFAQYTPNLITIRCNNNGYIKNIKLDSHLKKLESLYLENCLSLSNVDGSKVPNLQYVYVSHSCQINKTTRYALAFYNRGNDKYDIGYYEEAIVDYDRAIALDRKNAEYFNGRGLAKYYLDDYEGAIADYDKAIDLNPGNIIFLYNRGTANAILGLHEAAITDYNQAIILDRKYAPAFCSRGEAKYRLGQVKEALADYDQAIALKPKNVMAFVMRAEAKICLGFYQQAIADCDQAIVLNPENAQAFNNRGNAKCHLGLYAEALIDCKKAITLNPKDEILANNYFRIIELEHSHQKTLRTEKTLVGKSPTQISISLMKAKTSTATQLTSAVGFFISSAKQRAKKSPTTTVSTTNVM